MAQNHRQTLQLLDQCFFNTSLCNPSPLFLAINAETNNFDWGWYYLFSLLIFFTICIPWVFLHQQSQRHVMSEMVRSHSEHLARNGVHEWYFFENIVFTNIIIKNKIYSFYTQIRQEFSWAFGIFVMSKNLVFGFTSSKSHSW